MGRQLGRDVLYGQELKDDYAKGADSKIKGPDWKPPKPPRPNTSQYRVPNPSASGHTVNTMMPVSSVASPDAIYQGIFGTYTPETIINTKVTEYSMTGEDFSHEPEWIKNQLEKKVTDVSANVSKEDKEKIQEYSQQIVTGEAKPTTLFEEFNEPYIEARSNISSESIATKINQGEEYMTPTSLSEAKMVSDRVYMDTLKHRLTLEEEGSEEYVRIEQAIRNGPQDFSNPSNAYGQLGLGFNNSNYSPAIEEAARFQAATVKDYLESNNIPLYQEVDNERIDGGRVYLNTGTALQFFEEGAPAGNKELGHSYHINSGELGSYSNYELTPPPRESNDPLKKVLNVASVVLSVMYPQFAPILQATNTLVQGGDFEDALASAGKAYFTKMGNQELNQYIGNTFLDLGYDISNLPPAVQDVILDTSKAIVTGKSGTQEFEDSATGAILRNIVPDIDFESPDFDFNTPQFIKDFGDEIYAGIKAVGDVAEEGINIAEDALRPVGDFAEEVVDLTADAFEPVVDFVDEGLDYFGETVVDPALRGGSDVLSNVEDVVKEGGRVVDKYGLQPVKEGAEYVVDVAQEGIDTLQEAGRAFDDTFIDPIDDVIDTFGSEVVDPVLQTGSDVLSEVEDVLKEGGRFLDDIVDWKDLFDINMLGGGARKQTPTESLFSKEIYKTELKESPAKIFSDREIKNYIANTVGVPVKKNNKSNVDPQTIDLYSPLLPASPELFNSKEEEEEVVDLFATTV
jgi:hypothetical protein